MRFSIFSVLSFALCIAMAWCDTAKIVSCPGCRLNSLPKLRNFLKSAEIKNYEGLTISWERGKNPDLFFFDDAGNLKESFDLSVLEVDQIKDLLASRGFVQKQPVEL